MSDSQPNTHFDLIIAGGGLAGLSLAHALQKAHNWRIAIVESHQPTPEQPANFDERVFALSAMTVRILKTLGLWNNMHEQGAAIGHIHVSDQGSYGKVRLYAEQHGLAEFGQVLPARILGRCLQDAVAELDLTWFRPNKISATSIDSRTQLRTVTLESGDTLTTQLLVVAEGANSDTCKMLNVSAREHDYGHVAVIANVQTDEPHNNWAIERFTPSGPLALLPMPDNRRALVWTHEPQKAAELLAMSDDEFSQQLQHAMGYQCGLIERVGTRNSYPLKLRLVEQSVFPRAVVLGNAAHALHPIAGQGFNLGIRDVMELAMQLSKTRHEHPEQRGDVGNFNVLNAYQQARLSDQVGVAESTHVLALVFSNDIAPLQLGRSAALSAMAHLAPARNWLVQKAMGLSSLSQSPEEWLREQR
ncbi:2-octaprenyl-6-methoxyphenyl hydroxylase [Echinimonas agarilytica]|uniref:2-octaprenyl-6-methoxyphenyl hydroxylase n=1 Tax=Echinimonas agarilytica TaxID=1215918 RepID=A0AA41W500_9GAMM|nr:2-octaprenyl-6-methoxyphenyl hydroxylase [Echinimonas agarilytica]MCM2678891.1 2-octaprenyl-6-methoxyphenyl hydroxylase [Echinimonas agarilytica]